MDGTNHVRSLLLGAVVVLGLLGLTACEAEHKKPIKIGYSVASTGTYAKTGKYQQEAFQMWDEEVNKRGGLVGRPVCLIHYDDQSDPEKSVELYEKLITEDKVALVLGPCSSAVTNPVAGVTEKYQSPMITAFTVGAAQPEFVAELGDLAEYAYGASQWEPDPRLPSPEQREWVERYTNRWGREPDHHAASGWAACQVMEACIKQVGSLDREQLRDCLSETEMMPIHGPCKVDAGTGEQRGHEILLIQWQNGKKEIVYPAKYASAKPAHPTPPWGERQEAACSHVTPPELGGSHVGAMWLRAASASVGLAYAERAQPGMNGDAAYKGPKRSEGIVLSMCSLGRTALVQQGFPHGGGPRRAGQRAFSGLGQRG